MKRILLIFASLILVAAYIVHFFGVFTSTSERLGEFPNCSYLSTPFDISGPEDAVFFSSDILIGTHTNIVKINSKKITENHHEQGGFYAIYGVSTGNLTPKRINVRNYPQDVNFFPHGITLRDQAHLVVINHALPNKGERVETFLIIQNVETNEIILEFLHATQLEDHFLGISNSLVFLTKDRFLISDWHVFPSHPEGKSQQPIWQKIITMLTWTMQLKTNYLWDCTYKSEETTVCKKVANSAGIMNNGVAYDGKETLVLADSVGRTVKVFTVKADGSLQLTQTVNTSSIPDNINYDAKRNRFIVAGLNSPFEYFQLPSKLDTYLANKSSKSVVLNQGIVETIQVNKTTKLYEATEIFASSWTIVGLAGALVDDANNYLFLTSFTDKSLVVCSKK